MGWASISLRKMQLKQRINNYEQRLMHISQELQSMYDSSSYAQQAAGVEKSQALGNIATQYQANLDSLSSQAGSGTDAASLAQYNTAIQQEQLSYTYNKMITDSLFSAKSQALQDQVNEQETQLELEQEQVETQLEAARAEYQSLDLACSQDVKDGAIKLVG